MVKLKKTLRPIHEMGIRAIATDNLNEFNGNYFANTLVHALVYCEDYWNHLIKHLPNYQEFIDKKVQDGVNQLKSLLDFYSKGENRYTPCDDLKDATRKVTGYKHTFWEVIVVSDKRTDFKYNIDCSFIDNIRMNKLVNAFKKCIPMHRSEQGMTLDITIGIDGKIITIVCSASVAP